MKEYPNNDQKFDLEKLQKRLEQLKIEAGIIPKKIYPKKEKK